MAAKNYKAFIVEGDVREPQIIRNLEKIHFRHSNFEVITLPAGKNIYMLWKQMEQDDFDTDIIEVLRESSPELGILLEGKNRDDFSEVYLFFDYDGHQDNLSKEDEHVDIIMQMLSCFDNETENGKLYVSYPMVEAVRDYWPDLCGNEAECVCMLEEIGDYKNASAKRSYNVDCGRYTYEDWENIIDVFVMRVSCLYQLEENFLYEAYNDSVTPLNIYLEQGEHIKNNRIFILSAFPEFLLDYFPKKFWNVCVKHNRKTSKACRRFNQVTDNH